MGWLGPPRRGGREAGCAHQAVLPSSPCHPRPAQTELRERDHNKFMSVLDAIKDCEVDFVEYTCLLACLCT